MTWKNRAIVLLISVALMELVFLAYDLPSRVNIAVNSYLGFQQIDIWKATSEDFNHRKWLEAYLEQRALKTEEVDCRKVLDGDKKELSKANATEHQPIWLPPDAFIQSLASNCNGFIRHYGFLMDPLTRLEKEFPIAYSILSFKQSSQVVDLLRAIYRPQNFYCMHVDHKSKPEFRKAIEAVSACFPNVFMSSRSINVRWGNYTVLEPELVCMADLWKKKRWKYFINLTGQEFPLRTNHELVRILTAYNGANDIGGSVPRQYIIDYRWKKFLPAPHNITLYKGPVHIVASRDFVDYVLHSPVAEDFRRWCQKTRHPDEHFFNSLNHNPHLFAPGGGSGKMVSKWFLNPSIVRFKSWMPKAQCPGKKVVRTICILNVLDLPRLAKGKQLFANKFYADYSHLALKCLAEDLHNRTIEQTLGREVNLNLTYYEQQPFVKNRLSL